ncbi:hypothetical protein HYFRA_00013316 [Hymenoscyphus fraxineus]|uniref:Uncharacterized protein n=1 Tax=Hymenoscyphus fraxineus TaxID=746836 RepID=A0A9N9LBM5_9HELO|nr:hypothetical protein HYFRA_00013316 [Hymenoscyphus fraxineus]
MHYSTILALLSITTAAQATTIATILPRNANHVSMYDTNKCKLLLKLYYPSNDDKYYKWKGTATCHCVIVEPKAASIYTDTEPGQKVIAFKNSNCKGEPLGTLSKQKCYATSETFDGEAISSVLFWLPGLCDVEEFFEGLVKDVETLVELIPAVLP